MGAVMSMPSTGRPTDQAVKLLQAIRIYLQDEPTETQGALKVLHLDGDSKEARQAHKRFEAEVEALRKVQHPAFSVC